MPMAETANNAANAAGRYLFFDIECACVFKDTAKICAFGYCLTDEQFNILEKEDILINPKGKFHLTDRKGRAGLVLPYDYEDFKKHPAFPKVYDRIRALLEDENHLVFGHATGNDVKYLNLETGRFHLPAFRFRFYDTQLIYMTRLGSFSRQYSLESITQDLNVDFTPHRAEDDAYATMRAAQAMCAAENLSLPALLEKYAVLPGYTAKGRTVNGSSLAMKQYVEEARRAREEREKAHAEFCRYVEKNRPKKRSPAVKYGEWREKVFCFSREIENNLSASVRYVAEIYRRGGMYSFKSDRCTVYVRAEKDEGKRLHDAQAAQAEIVEEREFAALFEEALV